MASSWQLTEAQRKAARQLYHLGHMAYTGIGMNTVKSLIAKRVIQKTNGSLSINLHELAFTPEWQAWADVQFGTPTPDPEPTSEPVADEHPADDVNNLRVSRDFDDPDPSPVVAEPETPAPVASKPVRGVTWLRREDLIKAIPYNITFRYWQQQTVWLDLWILGFYSIEAIGLRNMGRKGAQKPRQRVSKSVQVRSIMNMQKRRVVKPTVAKREPLRETVMSIVSRIQTPLTGQVRRVA
jgi:hypothetical protein